MNIAFLSKEKKINKGSYRIPFIAYRNAIKSLGINVSDKITANTDAVVCMAGEGYVKEIKKIHPKIIVVCAKPHYEVNFPKSKLLSRQYLKNIINYLRPLRFNKSYVQHENDIKGADILIADSRRLLREFGDEGYYAVFLRLLEEKDRKNDFEIKKFPNIGEEINFTYHGNPSLINIEYHKIVKIIEKYKKNYEVKFNIVTDLNGLKIEIEKNTNIETRIYNYDLETIHSVLMKTHIGIVPDKLVVQSKLSKYLLAILFFSSYQNNLDVYANKRSSNAGRAYLFAQYKIPFIATSTEEILLDFPDYLKELGAGNDINDMKSILESLMTNVGYGKNIENMLRDFDRISIENECLKLIQACRNKKNEKEKLVRLNKT